MRKLMWTVIGFAAACFFGSYVAFGSWPLLLSCGVFPGLIWLIKRKTKIGKISALMCLGHVAGVLWYWAFDAVYLQPIRTLDGTRIIASAVVSDYSDNTRGGAAAPGRIKLHGRTYRIRLYCDETAGLNPGDQVTGTFYLRYTGKGGEREPTFHQGKGVFLLCYGQDDLIIQKAEKVPACFYPAVIRKNVSHRIDGIFGERTSGFARALLLGDHSGLTEKVDTDMKISGIRHVVAVSGLHVSILFGLIYFLCGRQRGITAVIGIPALLLFAAVAGFSPSVVRACVMQILIILAMLFNREYDPPTALSFAVLVLLAVNPVVTTSLGFQLSVGCVAGILLVSESIRQYLVHPARMGRFGSKTAVGRLCHFIAGSVAVTLGAMLFTVPLCSYYFGMISLVGILTNLMVLWAISLVFYGVILSVVLSLIWLPLGKILACMVSVLIDYCLWVSGTAARLPMASVYTGGIYMGAWLLFCYCLICVLRYSPKKHVWLFTGCILVGLAAAVLCTRLESVLTPFQVSVLDVGQGQSVLLENRGHAYLVDCGSEQKGKAADVARQALWSRGIRHLDGLILTHYDSDHVNGTEDLLNRISAEELYLPDIYDENGLREKIAAANEGNITWVREILTLSVPDGTLTVIPSRMGSTDNESGLCVLFQPKGYDILITGDRGFSGEQELMEDVDLPQLELLVVGHHGSRYSTGLEFLSTACPSVAAISAGKDNRFGHPSPETLARLKMFGCSVFRTDLDGTITFRG